MTLLRLLLAPLLVLATFPSSTENAAAQEGAGSPLIGWDTILDPDEDCEIKSTITITTPRAGKDLNPSRRGRGLNAPRLLKSVSGDFTAQVMVTHDFDPSVGNGGFIAAGLVIWEDDTHFLRMERSAFLQGSEIHCEFPPIEHWRNGNHIGFPPKFPPAIDHYRGRSTWLRIRRKDEKLIASISHDGKEWKVVKEKKDIFGEDISVGLHAINYCGEALTFQFDDFDIQLH